MAVDVEGSVQALEVALAATTFFSTAMGPVGSVTLSVSRSEIEEVSVVYPLMVTPGTPCPKRPVGEWSDAGDLR